MSELVLKSQRFREGREADWKRLESLLALLVGTLLSFPGAFLAAV